MNAFYNYDFNSFIDNFNTLYSHFLPYKTLPITSLPCCH